MQQVTTVKNEDPDGLGSNPNAVLTSCDPVGGFSNLPVPHFPHL